MRSVIVSGGTRQVLSRSEKKLLKAVIEGGGGLTITELCKRAKVSPKVWYRLIGDPQIGSLLPEALDFLLSQQLIPVISMVIKRALEGSAKHAELVCKISGLIGSEEGTRILQVFGSADTKEQFLGEAQIQSYVKALLK